MKVGTRDDSGAGAEATLREHGSGQKLFGRYTLIKILGRGGMGVVWLARDEKLERDVALKFLPDLIIHDRALLNDLKRETRRSLELTHKNIVRIYDFVDDERSGCISMEYIDGETLSNLRAEKEQKLFEPNELSGWTSQLCDGLDYAHNYAKIIHRDLKPANLMVNKKGDLKISEAAVLLGQHRSANPRASCALDDGAAERIQHRASAGSTGLGRDGRRLPGERSGKAAAVDGGSCQPIAVVPAANTDTEDTRNSVAHKNRHYGWRSGSLPDCDRWMVFREIKTACPTSGVRFEHTGGTSRGRLGKKHRRPAV